MKKIHILGASGVGTSTLGAALSEVLPHTHMDTDDYYWLTKYTEQRQISVRIATLQQDLSLHNNWVLTGSLCGWGNVFKNNFDLVIFLWISEKIRLERLKQREFQRYGSEILPGGRKYEDSQKFLAWASLYDHAGKEVRSKALHEQWLQDLPCPVLRIEGDYSVQERVTMVLDYIKAKQEN